MYSWCSEALKDSWELKAVVSSAEANVSLPAHNERPGELTSRVWERRVRWRKSGEERGSCSACERGKLRRCISQLERFSSYPVVCEAELFCLYLSLSILLKLEQIITKFSCFKIGQDFLKPDIQGMIYICQADTSFLMLSLATRCLATHSLSTGTMWKLCLHLKNTLWKEDF